MDLAEVPVGALDVCFEGEVADEVDVEAAAVGVDGGAVLVTRDSRVEEDGAGADEEVSVGVIAAGGVAEAAADVGGAFADEGAVDVGGSAFEGIGEVIGEEVGEVNADGGAGVLVGAGVGVGVDEAGEDGDAAAAGGRAGGLRAEQGRREQAEDCQSGERLKREGQSTTGAGRADQHRQSPRKSVYGSLDAECCRCASERRWETDVPG